jgi:hypothetical protein
MKEVPAPCSVCLGETRHSVLHETSWQSEDRIKTYAMLECCGCKDVCLAEQVIFTDDGQKEFSFYPSPVSRKEPSWLLRLTIGKNANLGGLLHEIYQAVHGGQYRLAAMGIRALLEQVMVSKAGDQGSFGRNLDAFHAAGYVSLVQRDTLNSILQIGHGAMHRAFRPTEDDLKLSLDIIEGVMAPMYHHQQAAEEIAERVPPRPRQKK